MSIYLGDIDTISERYGVTIYAQDRVKGADGVKRDLFEAFVSGTLLTDNISLRGENSYDSWSSMLGDVVGMNKTVSGIVGKIASGAKMVESVAGAMGEGWGLMPKQLTRQIWTGSQNPAFFVNVMFICLNGSDPSQSVVKRVNSVMRYLYPELDRAKSMLGFSGVLTAPAKYNPVLKKGLVRLQLGKWFNAPNLIIQNANFEMSKELNRLGEPVYATGQIMMVPYEAISYEEYLRYFTGGRVD